MSYLYIIYMYIHIKVSYKKLLRKQQKILGRALFMKRVLAVLLCLLCAMLLLVACGDNNTDTDNQGNNNTDNQGHTHTYKTNEDWSKDAQGHWYDATCDCEDAPITKLNHTDANNDGACDVCTFTNHEHEYTEDWTADCTNHWNAADCGHTVAGINVGAHVDEDADGRCDVCNYIIEDLHEHIYATEWTYGDGYHWHAALCEHKVEVADKAACNVNAAGVCTVCDAKIKEIDKTDILAVLNAAIANNFKVVTGNVVAKETVYGPSETVENGKTNKVYFILGNSDAFVTFGSYDKTGAFTGVDQYWYETLANGELFGVQIPYYKQNAGQREPVRNDILEMYPVSAEAEKLNGYNYTPGSILASGYDDNTTLAQTIANLYDILVLNVNISNANSGYDAETGKYSFSYNFFTVNKTDGKDENGVSVTSYYVEYYDVAVEFTVNADFVIDVADFTVKSYRNLEGVDEDISYDPETNTVTMLPQANATVYSYSVAQTSGKRTYVSIYPKASLVPQGFDLCTGTPITDPETLSVIGYENLVSLGEVITINEKKYIRLALGNPYPVTSSFAFLDMSDITVTWVNNDPNSTGAMCTMAPSYNWQSKSIAFMPKDNGEYTLTITIGETTKSFTIIIDEKKDEIPQDTADTKYVQITTTYGWEDAYEFIAPETGTYTFTIPAEVGFWNDAEAAPEYDPMDPSSNLTQPYTVVVKLSKGEKLAYTVGGLEKGVFAIKVAFEAGEIGGGEGGDGPAFDYNTVIVSGNNTIYFSKDEISANSATRKLTITVDGNYTFKGDLFIASIVNAANEGITRNADYTYDLVAGEYAVTFGMFSNFGMSANTAQKLNVVNNTSAGDEGDDGDDDQKVTLNGTYYAFQEGQMILTVVFSDDGTVVITNLHPMMGSSITANYEITGDTITLTDPETGNVLHPMAASVTLENGVPVSAGYNGWDYALSTEATPPAAPETPEVSLSNGDNTVPVTGDSDAMTEATLVTEGAGVYYITVGTNAVVIQDGSSTYFAGEVIQIDSYYAGDTYVFEVNSEDYSEGAVNLNVKFVPKADDEPTKDVLAGTHKVGDYFVEFTRNDASGVYSVTISTVDYSVSVSFTYDVTDNGDNTYTLSNLVYVPGWEEVAQETIDELIALDWVVSIDPIKEALIGYTIAVGDYSVSITKESGIYYIQITSSDYETTLYFTYTVTDNGNGTLTLNQTYAENANESGAKDEHLDAMSALEIVVNYDPAKAALEYFEYTGIDGYTLMFFMLEGKYYAKIFDADYLVSCYFTYTITEGANGAQIIKLTYASLPDYEAEVTQELIDLVEAHTITLGGLDGEGTEESPFVVEEAGDYVSPYQGGYTFPLFVYEVPANGYVTISSEYEALLIQYGTTIDTPNNNEGPSGTMSSVKLYALAGTKVYFKVADGTFPESAVDVPFTVSFEAFESDDASFLKGTWNGVQSSMMGVTTYTFNIGTNGTGKGSYVEWGQKTEFEINYILVDGNSVTINVTTKGWWEEVLSFNLVYNEETDTLSGDIDLDKTKLLSVGENYQINAKDDKYVYYASEDITVNLKVGASIMAGNVTITYSVNGGEEKSITFNESAEVALAAGDKLTVVITATTFSSLTVSRVYPLGSAQNPIKIESLPFDMTHAGNEGEKYYIYTATEDIILTITCPAGCLVSGTGVSKDANGNYVVTLKKGDSLTFNPWANTADQSDSATYTYTITGEAPVVVDPGEGGGSQGGETTGINGTYYGSNGSRGMRVIIDTVADTLTITRAASGYIDNFEIGSPTTYNLVYSEVLAMANNGVTGTISGTNIGSITFAADGTVESLAWLGANYTNFVKQ